MKRLKAVVMFACMSISIAWTKQKTKNNGRKAMVATWTFLPFSFVFISCNNHIKNNTSLSLMGRNWGRRDGGGGGKGGGGVEKLQH